MQTMRTQLAVIGGGPAGVCAAIAAAQHGVQTALVTDRLVLGGNSSSEIRVWTRGATGAGNLWAEEMGVWGELELRRLVLGVWNYVKNSGKFHADCYTLDWIGSIPGKRESRRMQTEYCLTEEDILAQRTFPDGAFYGGWYVDTHPSGGMYDSGEENCVQTPVNVYQIPLRCLYNRQVPNLLFAGRIIGVERSVFFSSRVMNTCALSGQAAGTLAAACLQAGKAPAELDAWEIEAIRRTLARDERMDRRAGGRGTVGRAAVGRAGGSAGGTAVSQGSCRDFPYSSIPESRRCLLHGQHPSACPLTHPETPWYIFQNHVHVPPVLRHLQAQALPRIPAQAQRPFANAPLPSPDAPANFQILRSTPSLPPPLSASSILLYQVYAPRPTHTVFWNTERSPFFDTVREAEAAL